MEPPPGIGPGMPGLEDLAAHPALGASGSGSRDRTYDFMINSHAAYHSRIPECSFLGPTKGIEPSTS